MGMEIKKLDQFLALKYLSLDMNGSNLDDFYQICFNRFRLDYSEFPIKEKLKIYFSGQYNGKTELTTDKDHSERSFIQDQIVRCEGYLKEPIHPDNREKLNIWIDYLKLKQKAIVEVRPIVPPWEQPLIALYFVYKDIVLTEKNRVEYAEQLQTEITPVAVRLYGEYLKRMNRTFTDQHGQFDNEDTRKANEMLKRLRNLKIIFESRGESVPDQLISDIETLNKNLRLK